MLSSLSIEQVLEIDKNVYDRFIFIYNVQLSPQCDEILLRCLWKGKVVDCMDKNNMFRMVPTASGHCCAFNSKKIDDKSFYCLMKSHVKRHFIHLFFSNDS